jgi:hypothetical protein
MRQPIPPRFIAECHTDPAWTIDVGSPGMIDAWVRTLGPSGCILWQYLARELATGRTRFTVADLCGYSGLANGTVLKSLDRLTRFGRLVWTADDVVSVEVACCPPRIAPRQLSSLS